MKTPFIPLLIASLSMTACDQISQKLGLDDPAKKEARQEGEGKAVGSACRQSGRAIEDCYSIYSWLPKSPIFAGWREMDAYMRENQLETIAPLLPPPEPPATKKKKAAISHDPPPENGKESHEKSHEKTEAPAAEKNTEKSAEKSTGKH